MYNTITNCCFMSCFTDPFFLNNRFKSFVNEDDIYRFVKLSVFAPKFKKVAYTLQYTLQC